MQDIEQQWKRQTLKSNAYFECQDFEKAITGYQQALALAEVLNRHPQDCLQSNIPFMQIYIISCNNLSNIYIERAQLLAAENMLKRALYFLLQLSDFQYIEMKTWQSELKRAAISLLNFSAPQSTTSHQEKLLEDILEILKEKQLI